MERSAAMAHAIELAWRGWGRVLPNPMVGAVVLRNGAMVGEGWHAEFGGEHAEPIALRQAGELAHGATLVVTLEPCAHTGKQPPCVGAIQSSGVAEVIMAVRDPDPVAAGGAAILREHGITVTEGVCAAHAAAQNAIFLHQARGAARPFVAVKLATSIDAKLSPAGDRGHWLTGPESREWVHWLRAGFDAIAVGSETALRDDPALTVRGSLQPRVPPKRVVFDRRLRVQAGANVLRGPGAYIVTSPSLAAHADAHPLARAGAELLGAETLMSGLRELHRRGVSSLLVEGGGVLASALQAANLVDRFYWLQAPVFLGHDAVPAWPAAGADAALGGMRWHVSDRQVLGSDTLLVVDRD